MRKNEATVGSVDEEKARIRSRYKGVDRSELEFIPAKPKENIFEDKAEKRVCAYCRVSTDDPNQTSSYELQKNHYEDFIKEHEGWIFAGIYADEGISGTSLLHRDECLRMIEDAKAGKFDLIITKSVSRLARNIVDCIKTVRELAALNPPVGVFFETEHIYTLDNISEMMLAVLSAAAQEESHTKSEIMNISIEQRFSRGIFLIPELLGYDLDEDGNLVINEDEAVTVKLCYYLLLGGFSPSEIAEILMDLKRPTKLGNYKWTGSAVVNIIRNERRCGDILSRKTFTPNYLDHKSKKNNHDRNQYRDRDHHEAIVSREVYEACLKLLDGYKYTKGMGAIPNLKVVEDGVLKGFVPVNRAWSGFSGMDYELASRSVYENETDGDIDAIKLDGSPALPDGNDRFFLEGFQVVRAEYFSTRSDPAMTISGGKINFNTACIRKLGKCEHVELLYNSVEGCLAVRPCDKDNPNAIRWSSIKDNKIAVLPKSCRGFIRPLFEQMDWDENDRYRIRGYYEGRDDGCVLVFDLSEPEIQREVGEEMQGREEMRSGDGVTGGSFTDEASPGGAKAVVDAEKTIEKPTGQEESTQECEQESRTVKRKARKKYVVLYPESWSDSFGKYEAQNDITVFERFKHTVDWDILRPARGVKGLEIMSEEFVHQLMEEAQAMIGRLRESAG